MQYREVQSTGDQVSILGYGGMRFPVVAGKIDEEKATEFLKKAIEAGVNYIDTAYFYHGGQSEIFLGKFLSSGYREQVKIATKMPPWSVQRASDLSKIFEDQRRKLKVDCIDYYLLHALNRETWTKFNSMNALTFLKTLKSERKIDHVGFSFHGDRTLFKEIIDAYPWDFCQIQYNLLDDLNQAGKAGLEYAASKGIAVFVMEPLRGGSLVKNLPEKVLEAYRAFDDTRSPAEWALRWIWNHPGVTMVLSGMTEQQHLQDNLLYAERSGIQIMSREELRIISDVKAVYHKLQKIPCTGCQYCMPCPFGVDIPRCFDLYNSVFLLNQKKMKGFYWLQLGGANGAPSYASLCKNCGKCLEHCPQSIQIPQRLIEVKTYMETPLMKPAIAGTQILLKVQKLFARPKKRL
ncbi:aldo/keto reductase [Fusibacter ferrireducens]|uniref:Aldo/keto reductase n=1 Tax=Fusibacter ferrireducens TaxID=2785058 RepID=A0ABR9ZTR4_9FIRM|nr:aldo/keto reductase [Fusibacter ferrireducens]MBF4693862.1 aldo/keto reductase [Fusibacter ferrireducens]